MKERSLRLERLQTLPRWTRRGVILGGYFLGSYLSTFVALVFSPSPEPALVFPGVAFDVALPLIFGLGYLPALFFAPYVGATLSTLLGTSTLPLFSLVLFEYALIKLVVYGGAAWFLVRVMNIDTRLSKLRDISWFLFIASMVAPLLAAILNEVSFYLAGFTPKETFSVATLTFWAGDATGVAMLAPLLLIWQNRASRLPFHKTRRLRLVFGVSLAFLFLMTWFAYTRSTVGSLDFSYLVFGPLVLIAVRCGFRRTAVAVLLLNASVVVAVNYRLTNPEIIALQFNLMSASYISLLLAGVFEEYYRNRERLHYTAFHDMLTGLPNRAQFLEVLTQLSARSSAEPGRTRQTYAVIFLDLDHFKRVNDAFGHTVGDALLANLAERMKACLRPRDTLARLGGDEFAVLLPRVNSGREALALTQHLSETLYRSNHVEGYDIATQASIGVALGRAGDNTAEVLRNADTAMHEAKFSGQVTVFDEMMERRLQERLSLEHDLKHALERGELSVAYQPIISLERERKGCVIGSEALMRWRHPLRGEIAPDVFIPIAEETGLIHELGEWLLDTVLEEAHAWREYVTVNLSVRQLQRRGFDLKVKAALERHAFPPERLVLEVTESTIMTDIEANIASLDALASLGVRVAMDDFGTGYASLSYLKRLPLHIMKIDRSFLSGVPDDPSDVTLVRTILAMARSLGLNVVAEGVETPLQEAFLLEHGCEHAQGFFYGRPALPPPRVEA